MIRQSHTATIEQNGSWKETFSTEPYEAGWASEAVFFIRALDARHVPQGAMARVQVSPDGIHWCDEGTDVPVPTMSGQTTFGRVRHFGGFLRIVGELPENARLTVMAYLALKE